LVWAEIPFISRFIGTAKAYDNTIGQMKELIVQNYNHPSICFWGISNEITMARESDELYSNLCDLITLAKKLAPSRLTVMAHISIVKPDSLYTYITDLQGYKYKSNS